MIRKKSNVTGFYFESITFLALAVLAPIQITDLEHINLLGIATIPFAFLALVSSYGLISSARVGRVQINRLIFYIYIYVFLAIIPLGQITRSKLPLPMTSRSTTELASISAVIVIIGIFFYEIGRYLSHATVRRDVQKMRVFVLERINLLLALAVSGAVYFIYKQGGISSLFQSRFDRSELLKQAVGSTDDLALVASTVYTVPLFIVSAIYCWRLSAGTRTSLLLGLAGISSMALCLFLFNPVGTARYMFGAVLICYVILALRRSESLGRYVLYMLVVGLLFVFPVLGQLRGMSLEKMQTVGILRTLAEADDGEGLIGSGDFDSFQQIMNIVAYVDDNGISYGNQMAGALLFWVPRSSWITKPQPTGVLAANYIQHSNKNLSMPIFGEMYVDGYYLSLSVGLLLIGFLAARLDFKFDQLRTFSSTRYAPFHLILNSVFCGCEIILLRGSLMAVEGVFVFAVVAMLSISSVVPAYTRYAHPRLRAFVG